MAVGQGIEAVPCAAAGKGLWDSAVSCRGEGDAITVTHTHTHSSHHHPAPTLLGAASGRPVHWLGLTTAGTTKLSHGLDRRRGYILLYVLQRRHFHGHSRTGLRRRGEMSEINANRRRRSTRRACRMHGRHIYGDNDKRAWAARWSAVVDLLPSTTTLLEAAWNSVGFHAASW